ncbi:hypothetical protein E2C01_029994 [Portunus trituberculatus]|uniref:Uncharacterized protein n=1 Tax=Portunus trituberculatus TaxID=210409 RepID=A0A5B7EQV6_PORTR|nr:hypothetical protein [Portunus trituberculatus]
MLRRRRGSSSRGAADPPFPLQLPLKIEASNYSVDQCTFTDAGIETSTLTQLQNLDQLANQPRIGLSPVHQIVVSFSY